MKPFTFIFCIASAFAASIDATRDSPLIVKIESTGNSGIAASITNHGVEALKIFTAGSILDTSPVEKAQVFSDSNQLDFKGIRIRIAIEDLSENSFQLIEPGETIKSEWDLAQVHDFSTGGTFNMITNGTFRTAELNSTKLTGFIPFKSNQLISKINGTQARSTNLQFRNSVIEKRIQVQSDCGFFQRRTVKKALNMCHTQSSHAANVARTGDNEKMNEYFKDSSPETRATVAGVYDRLANECGSSSRGSAKFYCFDRHFQCRDNWIAYTVPEANVVFACPYFFDLKRHPTKSRTQERTLTLVHEMTHLREIQGTVDHAYGHDGVTSLTHEQAMQNADTYALFAEGVVNDPL